MNRYLRWTALFLLLCATLAMPVSSIRAQDDAQAQLDATVAAMLDLQSFHFKLETTAGKTVFQDAFELKTVEGDLARPADFRASVAVKLAFVDLTLEVISLDGAIWVKNPLGGGDSFIQVTGEGSDFELPPMEFLNPDLLVAEALKYLESAHLAGTEEVDGQEMTVLTGTFDPAKLITFGTPTDDLPVTAASQPLDVKMWIDEQDRLVQVDFIGPLFGFEEGTGRLVRRVTFSDFNSDVSIEPPALSA